MPHMAPLPLILAPEGRSTPHNRCQEFPAQRVEEKPTPTNWHSRKPPDFELTLREELPEAADRHLAEPTLDSTESRRTVGLEIRLPADERLFAKTRYAQVNTGNKWPPNG